MRRLRLLLFLSLLGIIPIATTSIAQEPATAPATAPKILEISPANPDVSMGQKMKFTQVSKDGSGNVATPSTWFAAPFDLAGVDASGNISFFSPREVSAELFAAYLNKNTPASNDNKTAQNMQKVKTANPAVLNPLSQTSLATRKELIDLGRSLANCADGTPCKEETIAPDRIAFWLKNSKWRKPNRKGADDLDFSDFSAFHQKFGNALAKLRSETTPSYSVMETFKIWTWNVPVPRGPDGQERFAYIVIDHRPYASEEPFALPFLIQLAKPVGDYAATLAQLMANNKNGRPTVDQFVNFMLGKQR